MTSDHEEAGFAEPRWPVALALATFIAISITLRVVEPDRPSIGPRWLVPAIEIALLVSSPRLRPGPDRRASQVVPPGLDRPRARARRRRQAAWSTAVLIKDLIEGSEGNQLGQAAALVRCADLARQRPRVRAALLAVGQRRARRALPGEREYPDFAFSQQMSPELAPPGWRPKYVDYLILDLPRAPPSVRPTSCR